MAKRAYGNKLPSVTTILGILRKIGLEMWFKYNTIQFITDKSNKGKFIGTQIHEAIEVYLETGKVEVKTEYPNEVTNALKGFAKFTQDHPEYKFKNAEIALTSDKYGFNGTIDCLAEVNGKLIIADWKTGEAKDKEKPTIYDEYIYQVAAYVYLYNEMNNTTIDEAFILSLAKDKIAYNYLPIPKEIIENAFNGVFLKALDIYNNQKIVKQFLKGV